MGLMVSLLGKSLGSAAVAGYAAHRLLSLSLSPLSLSPSSSPSLPRSVRVVLTGFASVLGLCCYLKAWVQDYWIDRAYTCCDRNRDLSGRVAVVTGGTAGGLGFAAAELLYRQGATVVVTVRTKEKGELAVERLRKLELESGLELGLELDLASSDDGNQNNSSSNSSSSSSNNRASYVLCDFLSESSVRNCASELQRRFGGKNNGIDFLVLNAGIASAPAPNRSEKKGKDGKAETEEAAAAAKKIGAAKVWMTNHVGPFVFANELMPLLIQKARLNPSDSPRVVWVSSGAHKKATIDWDDPFHPKGTGGAGRMTVYGQSKLANILHAREYQKRVRDRLRREEEEEGDDARSQPKADVKCFALTPGAVWTSIVATPTKLLYPLMWFVLRTPNTGAQVIKMACLDNDLKGGEYLSNCCVKEARGKDGCSNDEAQWKRLWELTEQQVEAKEYERWFEEPPAAGAIGVAVGAAVGADADAANKKTD
eukprot:jgi/Psemu1/64277/estExt_Genemark1.C_580059